MIVRLGETEQKVCEYVAKERYNNARRKGITDNKKGPQSNYDTDLEGVASEMAAAKLSKHTLSLIHISEPTRPY